MRIAVALILASNLLGPPTSLSVRKDSYVPGPVVRVAKTLSSEKFSQDGKFLIFIDEAVEKSYPLEKQLIQRGDARSGRALVRFDLSSGVKQTIYIPEPGETLMGIESVGRGGDVICTIAKGVPKENDQLTWRAVYCPVGGGTRIIADDVVTRSFQVACSRTERKAFILICGLGTAAKYLYITPTQTTEKDLSVTGYQGGFFQTYSNGNPVAGLQGPAPDYKNLGNFEFSFASGAAFATTAVPDPPEEGNPGELIQYAYLDRSKGDPELGQSPLSDLVASPAREKDGKGKLIVAQGIIIISAKSPDGLAVLFLRDDGYYLVEMVKLVRKSV